MNKFVIKEGQDRMPGWFPILIVILGYVGVCSYLGTVSSSDYWMVRAFDNDEAGVLDDVMYMFNKKTFEPPSYAYGTLHNYLAVLYLNGIEIFHKPDVHDAILFLRFENALAGGAIIALLFILSKELSISTIGITSVMVLFLNSNSVYYGCNAKPEMLQLCFITLSLYIFIKAIDSSKERSWLIAAGIAAGLAFTTKYSGIFLVPLGGVTAYISAHNRCSITRHQSIKRVFFIWSKVMCMTFGKSDLHLDSVNTFASKSGSDL